MNKLEMKGEWNIVKGKLKSKYGELTDNDVEFLEGRSDEMLGRIQKRTGKTKEDLKKEIDTL